MTTKLVEWASEHRRITKIRPSDGCGRDAVLLAVERWYDFPVFGGYLGNVGLHNSSNTPTSVVPQHEPRLKDWIGTLTFLILIREPHRCEEPGIVVENQVSMIGRALRRLARLILGDYEFFRIYRYDLETTEPFDPSNHQDAGYLFRKVNQEEVLSAANSLIRDRSGYGGDDAIGYAVFYADEIVCLQWYWHGERYKKRNFWPLREDEAKSVDIITVEAHRGKGLATALKLYSANDLKSSGFNRLYSRVWHSNHPSIRVNEKAGWSYIAFVIEFSLFGLTRPIRVTWRK